MKIGAIGYNYRHEKDFIMERPNGTGCRHMVLVKSPSVFVINGTEYRVQKNSFVTFSPETPYTYYAEGEEPYTDDWIYYNFEEGDEEKFNTLNIPSDEIVYLGNIEELSQLIHYIAYEHFSVEEGHELVEQYFTEIFLIKLSRLIKYGAVHSKVGGDKNSRFLHFRSKIYSTPESMNDVGQMAEDMGMSRSGFQHTYKKFFGVSVMTDVIKSRVERAKELLVSTNLSIKEISVKCGYSNEYSFMRQFKEQVGQTPTEYRNRIYI